MDFKIIEKNLDYISLNFQFSRNGNPEIAKYLKDEIVSQVVADTTLAHNRWEAVQGRKNMLRSSGGLTLLIYSNKFIIQASGMAFLYLDEFDIKDIFHRARLSIAKNRKFDREQALSLEAVESVGRLDSQITIAIGKNDLDLFFSLNDFKGSGQSREFRRIINGQNIFTGKSWIKNKESDIYSLTADELKKCPQSEVKKRDFIRIYDKVLEIIDTTLPHSDKRKTLIDKYKDHISPDIRVFRIEIQEMDRGLSKHLSSLLDSDKATFVQLADERLKVFAKRNPFKMWEDLLSGAVKAPARK